MMNKEELARRMRKKKKKENKHSHIDFQINFTVEETDNGFITFVTSASMTNSHRSEIYNEFYYHATPGLMTSWTGGRREGYVYIPRCFEMPQTRKIGFMYS